jgi:hypothetical protein
MKSHRLLIGLVLTALAFGIALPHATAFHYRLGIGLGIWDLDWSESPILLERPEPYADSRTYPLGLALVLKPLWYYQEDLQTYDTVVAKLRVVQYGTTYGGVPRLLLPQNCVLLQGNVWECTYRNVRLSQDEDGITLDAALRLDLDIIVDWTAAVGVYHLEVSVFATAGPEMTFGGYRFFAFQVYT